MNQYNDKYIKTRIKNFNDRVYKINLQHNKILEDNKYCACLSVILLDSIFVNSNKEYYLQIYVASRSIQPLILPRLIK